MPLPDDLKFYFSEYFDRQGRAAPGRAPLIEGHAHTDLADGHDTAETMARAALDSGLNTLVFAEHMRADAPWRGAYFEEIGRLRALYAGRLRIIAGIEVRALDAHGALDADPEALGRADLVVGSVHGIPRGGDTFEQVYRVRGRARALELEAAFIQGMIHSPQVDIIGHPFGAYFEKYGMPPLEAVFELLKSAAAAGKAVELNVNHSNAAQFVRLAAELGVDFLFWPASDAHIARHVGLCVRSLFENEIK